MQKGGGAERKKPVDAPDTAGFEDEGGCPAEEDRGLWEPEKARKWMLPCSLQKEGSLWRHNGVRSPHREESMLVREVEMPTAFTFLGC